MSILKVENLCKRYDGFFLDNVSFSLDEGYIMGFIGRNGAGKSTTLRSMLGLVHPDSGQVTMFSKDFFAFELECKKNIGVVLGEFDYYPKSRLSAIAAVTRKFYDNWDDKAYKSYLELFKLDGNKRVGELSSGMKVKLALALALSHDARLLILDEPTSGLDPISRDELMDIFRKLIEDGTRSILFSTHITSDLDKCADYITYIKDGKIVESTDKISMTEEYRLVSGSKAQLTESFITKAVGYKENAFGFTGLVHASDEALFPGLQYAPADIENIMLYTERECK